MNLLALLWRYRQVRCLRFTDRLSLQHWQEKKLRQFRRNVLAKSPWFRRYLPQPLHSWSLMDKALMMQHFDQMNTAGLQRDELLACALKSEHNRDFTPKVGRFSVGLSSGTSGQRGVFAVSPQEQQIWAAGVLAKMLPEGLRAKERVALFLRADNHLYHSVNSHWLTLDFYDLLASFPQQVERLADYNPTIIVAPAQVLRALALAVLAGDVQLQAKKVISVAEVLEPQDRLLLQKVFADVGEIYQATEGFLAATCSCGTLHLNEEFIHVEPQWLDERRFIPVITDFTRRTQPIVRYRLDDVLVVCEKPCPCGSATLAIDRIEGRQDDQLCLPGSDRIVTVFADACSRVIAQHLPLTADYRLIQTTATQLQLIADCEEPEVARCRDALNHLFTQQGVNTEVLDWQLVAQSIPQQFATKRRRIICQWSRE